MNGSKEQPPGLEDLLAAARRDAPAPADVARLADKLFPPPPPPQSPASGVAAAVVVAIAALGVARALAVAPSPFVARTLLPDPPAITIEEHTCAPEASSAEVPRGPEPRANETSPSVARPRAAPSRAKPAVDVDETELLVRAVRALASNPREALAITDAHARLFPRGALAQERERIAIEALVASGDRAAARERGARFLVAYPRSAYAARVVRLVGFDQKSQDGGPMGGPEDAL